jgi:hypothetical protein
MTLQSPPPPVLQNNCQQIKTATSEMGMYLRKACMLLELHCVFSLLRIINKPSLIVYVLQQKTHSH